jgi:WD40 repeat protein
MKDDNDEDEQQRRQKRQRKGIDDDDAGDLEKEGAKNNETVDEESGSTAAAAAATVVPLPWAQRHPDIPSTEHYHMSWMHAAVVTHCVHNGKHGYVVTASADGVVKFWKRLPVAAAGGGGGSGTSTGIVAASESGQGHGQDAPLEFVKSFAAHDGPVGHLAMDNALSQDFCCSIGATDGLIKFYDVRLFDSVSMIQTKHSNAVEPPSSSSSSTPPISKSRPNVCLCEWFNIVLVAGAASGGSCMTTSALAVSDSKYPGCIYIYSPDDDHTANEQQSASSSSSVLQTITLHGTSRITALAYNRAYHCMISTDEMVRSRDVCCCALFSIHMTNSLFVSTT